MDLKPTRFINEALILQLSWKLLYEKSQWSQLLLSQFFSNGHPINHYFCSSVWSGIKSQTGTVIANYLWIVRSGGNINFWTDNWIGAPLADTLQVLRDYFMGFTCTLNMAIVQVQREMPSFVFANPTVASQVSKFIFPISPLPDMFAWLHSTDGMLTAKDAFNFLHTAPISIDWASSIWRPCIPHSHSFTF